MGIATVKIQGLKELQSELRKFPARMRDRVLQSSMNKAVKVVRDEAIQNAPRGRRDYFRKSTRYRPGSLKKSIKSRAFFDGPYSIAASVYARNKDAYYAHMVEFGHKRVIVSGRRKIDKGYQAPNPFMTRAYDSKKEEVIKIFSQEARKKARRMFKKINAGGA